MGHCNTIFSYPSFLSCSFCKSIDNSSNGPKNLSWQWDRFIVLEKRQNNPFKFSDKAFSSISVLSHVSEEIEFEYCAYYRDPKNKKSILVDYKFDNFDSLELEYCTSLLKRIKLQFIGRKKRRKKNLNSFR